MLDFCFLSSYKRSPCFMLSSQARDFVRLCWLRPCDWFVPFHTAFIFQIFSLRRATEGKWDFPQRFSKHFYRHRRAGSATGCALFQMEREIPLKWSSDFFLPSSLRTARPYRDFHARTHKSGWQKISWATQADFISIIIQLNVFYGPIKSSLTLLLWNQRDCAI